MEWHSNGSDRVFPVWKVGSSTKVVARVAHRTLGYEPSSQKHKVAFMIGEGDFNKAYKVVVGGKPYVLRVALPICPFWKTESEVATMRFVKERTSAPVPTVLAYDSSTKNELGYEWILMIFVPGKPLRVDLRQRSMQSKEAIVRELAAIQKDLLKPENQFGGIGSVYSIKGHPHTCGVGHAVMLEHWYRECADTSKTYGPFSNTAAWFKSRTDTLLETQRWLQQNLGYKEHTQRETRGVIRTTEMFQDLLDERLPKKPLVEPTYLRHIDLHFENVLVDEDGRLAAILDWEWNCVVPEWRAIRAPKFMFGCDRSTEPRRDDYGDVHPLSAGKEDDGGADVYYGDHEGKVDTYWEALMEWEKTHLRELYAAELGSSGMDGGEATKREPDYAEYWTVLDQLRHPSSQRCIYRWAQCLRAGNQVAYQDVVDAFRDGTLYSDERFRIVNDGQSGDHNRAEDLAPSRPRMTVFEHAIECVEESSPEAARELLVRLAVRIRRVGETDACLAVSEAWERMFPGEDGP